MIKNSVNLTKVKKKKLNGNFFSNNQIWFLPGRNWSYWYGLGGCPWQRESIVQYVPVLIWTHPEYERKKVDASNGVSLQWTVDSTSSTAWHRPHPCTFVFRLALPCRPSSLWAQVPFMRIIGFFPMVLLCPLPHP